MALDLPTLAQTNRTRLAQAFDFASTAPSGKSVRALSDFISTHARIAINMDGAGLLAFLRTKKYVNVWQVAEADNPTKVEDYARVSLGAGFETRRAMDDGIEGGRSHIYGYLYAGGAGSNGPRPYSAVLKPPALGGPEVFGIIAHDSIELSRRYFKLGEQAIDDAKIALECAAWDDRHVLASLKIIHSLLRDDAEAWPGLLASLANYLEVRIGGPAVTLAQVETIVFGDDSKYDDSEDGLPSLLESTSHKTAALLAADNGISFVKSSEYGIGDRR